MKMEPNIDKIINSIQHNNQEMKDQFIHDDEQSRREFDAYLELWEKSADVKAYDKIDAESDWRKVRSRMNLYSRSKKLPLRTFILRIAAILVLAVGLAFFLVQVLNNASSGSSVYIELAATNKVEQVELPDGSIIALNKGAKIIRNNEFGKTNRDIILEGEAFFEVARNEALPFKVHTQNSIVEVLGTRFDVKADSQQVVVGVVSGKVAFYESSNSANRLELTADNSGYFRKKDKKLEKGNLDKNQIAWLTRQFDFVNKPLHDVCQILAEYYNLELTVEDGVEFTDSIVLKPSTESLDVILKNINDILVEDIKLYNTDKLLIVRKK